MGDDTAMRTVEDDRHSDPRRRALSSVSRSRGREGVTRSQATTRFAAARSAVSISARGGDTEQRRQVRRSRLNGLMSTETGVAQMYMRKQTFIERAGWCRTLAVSTCCARR